MPTLAEDREKFRGASVAELERMWDGLWQVDVQIAFGGKNLGHETIQSRYLCWRKGTARIDIETAFRQHPNWQFMLDRKNGLRVLAEHPGPCTVIYWVYGIKQSMSIGTLRGAYEWISFREQDGAQATNAIVLDDGSTFDVYENLPVRIGWVLRDDI